MTRRTGRVLLTDIGRHQSRSDAVRFDGHPPHRHDCPQLLYLVVGRAVVTAGEDRLPVAEGEGLWLPAGLVHALELEPGGVVMGPLLTAAGEPPAHQPRLVADPAIRRLMTTLLSVAPRTDREIQVCQAALERALRAVTGAYFPLRLPTHPAALAIAHEAVRSRATLKQLAERRYVSARHAQRLFHEQTGLSFATWRTRARLNAAIARLYDGRGMEAALEASGFTTREGLRKALSRECGIPLRRLLGDPVGALATEALHAA